MVHHAVVAVCVVLGLASQKTSAQWFGNAGTQSQAQVGGWGQSASPAMNWGNSFQQRDTTRYLTCIAMNSNNDEMRVTFSSSNNNSPWDRFGGWRGINRPNLRLAARVTSGSGSPLQGQFQLVVTEYSRSEEVCLSRALGEILTDRNWWGQLRTPHGIVGNPISITSGQTTTSAESMEGLNFEHLPGRGLVLCPSHQIRGSTCVDPIPLCCKIGYDSQPATSSFTHQGQLFPQGMQAGGFGNNNGLGGGLNQGMGGGLNQGMGGGFNQGMGGPLPQGINQGLGGMNQGSRNPEPMGQGMNGLNSAGTGNIGGLTFQNVGGMQ